MVARCSSRGEYGGKKGWPRIRYLRVHRRRGVKPHPAAHTPCRGERLCDLMSSIQRSEKWCNWILTVCGGLCAFPAGTMLFFKVFLLMELLIFLCIGDVLILREAFELWHIFWFSVVPLEWKSIHLERSKWQTEKHSLNFTALSSRYDWLLECILSGRSLRRLCVSVCVKEGGCRRESSRGSGKHWGTGEYSPSCVLELFCSKKLAVIPHHWVI